ncbi:hypothetical protein Aduo_009393 [Ancylostoma duodenale]
MFRFDPANFCLTVGASQDTKRTVRKDSSIEEPVSDQEYFNHMVNEIRGEGEQGDSEDSEDHVETCEQRFPPSSKGEDHYKWAREVKSKKLRELERIL